MFPEYRMQARWTALALVLSGLMVGYVLEFEINGQRHIAAMLGAALALTVPPLAVVGVGAFIGRHNARRSNIAQGIALGLFLFTTWAAIKAARYEAGYPY